MQSSMFIGLDVHTATISVAIAQGERGGEVRHWGTIPHCRTTSSGCGSGSARALDMPLSYVAGPAI